MSYVLVVERASGKATYADLAAPGKAPPLQLPEDPLQFVKDQVEVFANADGCRGNVREGYIVDNADSHDYYFLLFSLKEAATPVRPKSVAKKRGTRSRGSREVLQLLQNMNGNRMSRRLGRRRGGSRKREVSSGTIEPEGFVYADEKQGGVYLDIICAKRNGANLLSFFLDYNAKAAFVELNALGNVVAYYPKFGFEFKKKCGDTPYDTKSPAYQKLLAYISAQKERKGSLPSNNEEAYETEAFLNLLLELHKMGLNVKKTNCGKPYKNETREELAERIKGNDCALDGYTMVKCAK
jgi:hypothetical protein